MTGWLRLLRDEKGVSAIEYCLLAVIIAVSLVAVLHLFGANVTGSVSRAGAGLSDANGGGSGPGGDTEEGEED